MTLNMLNITLLNCVDQCLTVRRSLADQRFAWQNYLKKYGPLTAVPNIEESEPNFWRGLIRIILLAYVTHDKEDFSKFGSGMSPIEIHFSFNSSANQLHLFAGWGLKRIELQTKLKFDDLFDGVWNRYLAILSTESFDSGAEKEKVAEFAQQFQNVIANYRHLPSAQLRARPLRRVKCKKLRETIFELLPYTLDESVNMAGLQVKVNEQMIDDLNKLFISRSEEGQRFIHIMAILSISLTLGFKSMHELNETDVIAPYDCFFVALNPETFGPIFSLYTIDLAIRSELQMTTVDDQLLIRDMIESIRRAIRQKFIATSWLKNSRELLKNLDQLLLLYKVVGFAEQSFKDDNLTRFELNHFSPPGDDIFSIVERVRMSNLRLIHKLSEAAYVDSFMINAANKHTHVEFHFLSLQNPYFNRPFPDSYNIGFSGSIIGHEFFHSFAPNIASKRFYLHAEYHESLACYENFYREKMCYNVTIGSQTKEMCADGANDLSENIPDVEGTRVAFEALKHKLGDNGKLKLRPLPDHFEFTNEQLFFIARSQFWCDNDFLDDEYFVKVLKSSGPHPPHNVRVNAVPMQMHEFAEAFNCKPMDKMVTVEAEKCYLLPSGQ